MSVTEKDLERASILVASYVSTGMTVADFTDRIASALAEEREFWKQTLGLQIELLDAGRDKWQARAERAEAALAEACAEARNAALEEAAGVADYHSRRFEAGVEKWAAYDIADQIRALKGKEGK